MERDNLFFRQGGDCLAQEAVSQVGCIAAERARIGHLVDRIVERPDDGRGERLRHVADAEPDDLSGLIGVRRSICLDLLRDGREQVVSRKLQVRIVRLEHGDILSCVCLPFGVDLVGRFVLRAVAHLDCSLEDRRRRPGHEDMVCISIPADAQVAAE